jgi:hypothetical protein
MRPQTHLDTDLVFSTWCLVVGCWVFSSQVLLFGTPVLEFWLQVRNYIHVYIYYYAQALIMHGLIYEKFENSPAGQGSQVPASVQRLPCAQRISMTLLYVAEVAPLPGSRSLYVKEA